MEEEGRRGDVARPTSAPPMHASNRQDSEADVESYRSDPAYCKWYYSQQPRDPRLPPPIVRTYPSVKPTTDGKSEEDMANVFQGNSAASKSVGLVAMIQEDFPRTPSPVYAKLQSQAQQQAQQQQAQQQQAQQQQAQQQLPHQLNSQPFFANPERPTPRDEAFMQQFTQAMAALNFGNQNYQQGGYSGVPQNAQFNQQFPPQMTSQQFPSQMPQQSPMMNMPPNMMQQNYPMNADMGKNLGYGSMPSMPSGMLPGNVPKLPGMTPNQLFPMGLPQGLAQLGSLLAMGGLNQLSAGLNQMGLPLGGLNPLAQAALSQLSQHLPQMPQMPQMQQPQMPGQMNQQSNQYFQPPPYGNQGMPNNYGTGNSWNNPEQQQQQHDNYYQNYDQQQQQSFSQNQNQMSQPSEKMPRKGPRRERGHDDAPRTRLMEEFRQMKTKKWELQDLVGHIVEFSRDQEGSRLIQRKLEGPQVSDNEKELVFNEVYKEALGLMTDVFGNYVIQKLFEHGLPKHRKMLAGVLKGNVLALTLQTYGCRVIQKALEVIDLDDQLMVADELDGHVLRCVLDQNGNHVIQKCIERIPPHNVNFIVQSFIGNVQNLAVHAYGCRVIQRILEYCEDNQEVISPILTEILENVHTLVRDQYGNYVVQHVLINGKPSYQLEIIERLRGQAFELAQHKFASNVVEKMFQYGNATDRNMILADLLRPNSEGMSALHIMMKDQYANYVVQKLIDLADDSQKKQIIDHVRPQMATLRKYTYGKHIIARIEKLHGSTKINQP